MLNPQPKMVDQLLGRSGLDVQRSESRWSSIPLRRLRTVRSRRCLPAGGLIERELTAGTLHRPTVVDLQVRRQLKPISNPSRYCSVPLKLSKDVLPVFASADSPLRQGRSAITPQEVPEDELVQNQN